MFEDGSVKGGWSFKGAWSLSEERARTDPKGLVKKTQ